MALCGGRAVSSYHTISDFILSLERRREGPRQPNYARTERARCWPVNTQASSFTIGGEPQIHYEPAAIAERARQFFTAVGIVSLSSRWSRVMTAIALMRRREEGRRAQRGRWTDSFQVAYFVRWIVSLMSFIQSVLALKLSRYLAAVSESELAFQNSSQNSS